jgi:hypothetical protein
MEKKIKLGLAFAFVFILGMVIGVIFFSYGYVKYLESQAFGDQTAIQQQADPADTPISTTEPLGSDELWATYDSPQGISFKYPRQISTLDRCGDKKKDNPYVGTTVIEDNKNGIVYVAPEYYFDYPATADGSQDTSKTCQKISYSLDQINGEGTPQTAYYGNGVLGGLNIIVREIRSRTEFDKFVQDVFGPACKAEDQPSTQSEYKGEYRIKYDKKAYEDGSCFVNFTYKLDYNAEQNKAFFVNLGQDCNIDNGKIDSKNPADYECYTMEIADSIQIN